MTQPEPAILALDFDGVLCDGLLEYFQTTCRTYREIWPEAALDGYAERFYRLRPAIETGWEMPVLLRALVLGYSDEEILQDWPALTRQLVESENLDSRDLAARLDAVRDRWLQEDLAGWLQLHRFYPGVVDQLSAWLATGRPEVFIVTTKEGRFAQRLLQDAGLEFPGERVLGKEVQQPKPATLRQLRANAAAENPAIWFVEDRLKTLQAVAAQPDLTAIELFLADWGYNRPEARAIAQQDPRLHRLSLAQFTGLWAAWREN